MPLDAAAVSSWIGGYLGAFAVCARGEGDMAALLGHFGVPMIVTSDEGVVTRHHCADRRDAGSGDVRGLARVNGLAAQGDRRRRRIGDRSRERRGNTAHQQRRVSGGAEGISRA
jgi:hypothetical protein